MRPADLAKNKFSDLVELTGAVMTLQELGEKLKCFSWSEASSLGVMLRQIREALQIKEENRKKSAELCEKEQKMSKNGQKV